MKSTLADPRYEYVLSSDDDGHVIYDTRARAEKTKASWLAKAANGVTEISEINRAEYGLLKICRSLNHAIAAVTAAFRGSVLPSEDTVAHLERLRGEMVVELDKYDWAIDDARKEGD